MAETCFTTPYGSFDLRRYPARRNDPLQAWNGADTLLLEESDRLGLAGAELLVANDEHGALATALQPALSWTDSALAAQALANNLARNERAPVPVVWSTASPAPGPRCAVMRVPRQLPWFEYQLTTFAACLPEGATVLAAGMDKHLSGRTAQLLEQYIGPTERHPGRRKARLFQAVRDSRAAPEPASTPGYHCEAVDAYLCTGPNVFSRDGLDLGSRFLLGQLDQLAPVARLTDLACGNGVLGLAAWRAGLARQLLFCDESAMAINAARTNCASLLPDDPATCEFHHGDGLLGYRGPDANLILCNPPFHSNHTVDEFAGRHLLGQCARHLADGGQLCLVANRHLDYRPTLRRDFASVEKLAQNSKFIVWLARKQA